MSKKKSSTAPDDTSRLVELGAEIKKTHAKVEEGIRASLAHAKAAGDLLMQVKELKLVPHGQWMNWVEEHCSSYSTGLLYMTVARGWDELLTAQSLNGIENLTLYDAAKLLATSRRTVDAEERKSKNWQNELGTTTASNAANRLVREVNAFHGRLKGRDLHENMAEVVDAAYDVMPDSEIEKLVHAFQECRHQCDRYIEALRRRLDKAQVAWTKDEGATLLTYLKQADESAEAA